MEGLDVVNFEIDPTKIRVGHLEVSYHELRIRCQLMVWKKEKLWIKFPEFYLPEKKKCMLVWWPSKQKSDEVQNFLLKKVFDKYAMDLEKAIDVVKKPSKKLDDK